MSVISFTYIYVMVVNKNVIYEVIHADRRDIIDKFNNALGERESSMVETLESVLRPVLLDDSPSMQAIHKYRVMEGFYAFFVGIMFSLLYLIAVIPVAPASTSTEAHYVLAGLAMLCLLVSECISCKINWSISEIKVNEVYPDNSTKAMYDLIGTTARTDDLETRSLTKQDTEFMENLEKIKRQKTISFFSRWGNVLVILMGIVCFAVFGILQYFSPYGNNVVYFFAICELYGFGVLVVARYFSVFQVNQFAEISCAMKDKIN